MGIHNFYLIQEFDDQQHSSDKISKGEILVAQENNLGELYANSVTTSL